MKTKVQRCVARLGCIVSAIALCFGPDLMAQENEVPSAVFVRDSSAAQDKMVLAQRMERFKEWDTAAQLYQEVIDQYGDRVLPTHRNERGTTDRYVSVSKVVQDRLGLWPAEGREVYLSQFEPSARIALEQAGDDATALGNVVSRYFVSESGRLAGLRLFELHFEDAQFAGAAIWGDRLLNHHPDLADEKPMLMLRTAVAWRFAGDTRRAEQIADRLRTEFPKVSGRIGGEEVNLSQWLDSNLSKPLGAMTHSSLWNSTFGGPDQTAIAQGVNLSGELGQLGLIASIPIGREIVPDAIESITDDEFIDDGERSDDDTFDVNGSQTGILPVIGDDELFINDNGAIHALSLVTGEPLAGWSASWPTTEGRFTSQAPSARVCVQSGLTLTERDVIAILDQAPPQQVRLTGVDPYIGPSRLVCLDRSTGMLRWQTSLASLETSDDSLKNTQMVGTPLVVNGRVYVATRGGRSNQFEDVFLICLDQRDGRLIWSRHLMSGSSPTQLHVALRPAAPSAIYVAYADGRVFVASDVGAAAALNAADGSIDWLSLVERPVSQLNHRFNNSASMYERLPAFIANPPMVSRGQLWHLATGDSTLHCFDTADGSIKLSIDLRALTPKDSINRFWVLCGIDDQAIVLTSDRFVLSLDRKKLEAGAAGSDALMWRLIIANESGLSLAGRPMVTADSIYVSTGSNLRKIDRQRARVVGTYPASGKWRAGDGGNVLLTNDSVVISSSDRVRIYSDLTRIQKRLLEEAQAAPASPWPRLRLAQASFRSRNYSVALDSLSQAVDLAKANDALAKPQGDSILVTANAMTRFFSRQPNEEKEFADLSRRAFDILERAADEPAERAACLIQRARSLTESSPAQAINLLQQVLADPTLDSIQIIGTQTFSSGDMARQLIQDIVRSRGSILMQAIDSQARDELDEALASNNIEAIEAVARRYPLSPAWSAAMGALARHYESTGKIDSAINIHQKLLRNLSDANRAPSLASLARLSLEREQVALALAYMKRLRAIAGDSNQTMFDSTSDPTRKDLQSAIESLEAGLADAELTRLPELKFNERAPGGSIARDRITEVKEVQELVIPELGHEHRQRVIARMTGSQISAFEAGRVEPVWSISSAITSNVRCLWKHDAVTIVGGEAIEHVNQNGKLAWQLRTDKLKPVEPEAAIVDSNNWLRPTRNSTAGFPTVRVSREVEVARQQRIAMNQRRARLRAGGQPGNLERQFPVAQPGKSEKFDLLAVSDQSLFVSTTNGRVVALDLQKGKVNWMRVISDVAPARLVFTGAVVGLIVNDASSSRLVMLDPDNGEIVHTLVLGDSRTNGFVNLGTDGAGLLVALTANQMIGFDTLINPRQKLFDPVIPSMNSTENSLLLNTRPHQIVFSRDRFAVLIDVDSDAQRVGLFESNTGKPVMNLDGDTQRPITFPVVRQPNTVSAALMRIVGERLYVWSAQSLASYSVSNPTSTGWKRRTPVDDPSTVSYHSLPIARDLVVAITYRRGRSTPTLETFSRMVVSGNLESGLNLDEQDINLPIALTTRWLAVDGGLYTRTLNGRLIFLPASN